MLKRAASMLVVALMSAAGASPALAAPDITAPVMKSGGWARFSMFAPTTTARPSVDFAAAAQAVRRRVAPTPQTAPSAVCTMKVVPVDLRFDASMRRPAPIRPTPSVKTTTPGCRAN